jgi:hypothetical protein
VTGSLRVFDLSVGEMLWSRRTIFMALVVGMPVALAAVFRVLDLFGVPAMRVNGARVSGPAIFGAMVWLLYLRFLVPVLGAFYGTALIADEVEDRTITYLFTRPISRGTVVAGKYLAYLVCTALVVLPSVMIVYFLVTPIGGGVIGQGFCWSTGRCSRSLARGSSGRWSSGSSSPSAGNNSRCSCRGTCAG